MVLVEAPSAAVTEPTSQSVEQLADSAPASPASTSDFEDAAGLFDQPLPAPEPITPKPSATEPTQEPTLSSAAAMPDAGGLRDPDLQDTVEDLAVQGRGHVERPREAFAREDSDAPPVAEPELTDYENDGFENKGYDSEELDDRPLLPNADWTSATTAAWRNRALTAIASVVGIALAITAFVIFNRSGGSEGRDGPVTPEVAQVEPPKSGTGQSTPPVEPSQEAPGEVAPVVESIDPGAESPPVESPGEQPNEVESPPQEAESTELIEPIPMPQPGEEEPEVSPENPDTPPGLALDPDEEKDGETSGSVADTLRDFGKLLGPPPASESETGEAPVDLEVVPDAEVGDGPAPLRRPGARIVDVDARLQDPIESLQFKQVQLVKFLRFIADYSTIPITLDADALVWAKLTPTTTIDVDQTDSTVAKVLTEALTPLNLHYRIESDQLFVTRIPKNVTGLRSVTFKLKDLVGDDEDRVVQLGEMVMDLVEPDSWTRRGGDGSLNYVGTSIEMEQAEPVLFAVLDFVQKMRVAKWLKIEGPYPASVFRLGSRTTRAAAKLGQPISLTYIKPAPFERIIDKISETARIHILIDWRALAEADWSPDGVVPFATAGEPLTDALTKLLDPMELTYRVVSGSVLQITTQEAAEARLEVEFYKIEELLKGNTEAAITQAVHEALGEDQFRDFGGDNLVKVDVDSKCLLACMPQAQQVQLEKWLTHHAAARLAAK